MRYESGITTQQLESFIIDVSESLKQIVEKWGDIPRKKGFKEQSSAFLKSVIHDADENITNEILAARFILWKDISGKYDKSQPVIYGKTSKDIDTLASIFLTYINLSEKLSDLLGGKSGIVRNVADEQYAPTIFKLASPDVDRLIKSPIVLGTNRCRIDRTNKFCTENKECSIISLPETFLNIASLFEFSDPETCEENHKIKNKKKKEYEKRTTEVAIALKNCHKLSRRKLFDKLQWKFAEHQLPLVYGWLSSVVSKLNIENEISLWVFPNPSNTFPENLPYHGAAWVLSCDPDPLKFLKWKMIIREIFWRSSWIHIAEERLRAKLIVEIREDLSNAWELQRKADKMYQRVSQAYTSILNKIDRDKATTHILNQLKSNIKRYMFPPADSESVEWIKKVQNKLHNSTWVPHNTLSWKDEVINIFIDSDEFKELYGQLKITIDAIPIFFQNTKWNNFTIDHLKDQFSRRHVEALKTFIKFDKERLFSIFLFEIFCGFKVHSESIRFYESEGERAFVWFFKNSKHKIIELFESFVRLKNDWEVEFGKNKSNILLYLTKQKHQLILFNTVVWNKDEYNRKSKKKEDPGELTTTIESIKSLDIRVKAHDECLTFKGNFHSNRH